MPLPDCYLPAAVYPRSLRHAGSPPRRDPGRLRPPGPLVLGLRNEGVVPDVVTVAKATGNGYPLGAVVTLPGESLSGTVERGVLLLLDRRPPGLQRPWADAWLDLIRDEDFRPIPLVGAHLKAMLDELCRSALVDFIGRARVRGLYPRVSSPWNGGTREPATRIPWPYC